jgi:hypothetical protein
VWQISQAIYATLYNLNITKANFKRAILARYPHYQGFADYKSSILFFVFCSNLHDKYALNINDSRLFHHDTLKFVEKDVNWEISIFHIFLQLFIFVQIDKSAT